MTVTEVRDRLDELIRYHSEISHMRVKVFNPNEVEEAGFPEVKEVYWDCDQVIISA